VALRRVAIAVAAVAVLMAVALRWPFDSPPAVGGPVPDCRPRPLGRIRPGTRVANRPPPAWTHLVFKNQPMLASGDIDKLQPTAVPLAKLLFSTMVARVRSEEVGGRDVFHLEEVAIGLGTRIGQYDVIITTQTQSQLGADLGFLEQIVLSGAEEQVDQVFQVAKSDTMAIVDVPNTMLSGGRHRTVVLRYLFLVRPADGGLATVVWPIDPQSGGAYRLASGSAVLQPPNLVQTCPLHVDKKELIAGIPTAKAFAVTRLPPGDPVPIPPSLREIAGRKRLTADMARRIEADFRKAIGSAGGQ